MRRVLGALLALAMAGGIAFPARAAVLLTASDFGPVNTFFYPVGDLVGGVANGGPFSGTAAACDACGNPGSGLRFQADLQNLSTRAELGVLLPLAYDPATQGAITSIDVSVDKILSAASAVTGPGPGLFNNVRPMILQDGKVFVATIPATPLRNGQASTGWLSIAATGLRSRDFDFFDPLTGTTVLTSGPDFAGGAMQFGILNTALSRSGEPQVLTSIYDNLVITLNQAVEPVPEPGSAGLLAAALLGFGLLVRHRAVYA